MRVRIDGAEREPKATSAAPPSNVNTPANMTNRMTLNKLFNPCRSEMPAFITAVTSDELAPIENANDPCTG